MSKIKSAFCSQLLSVNFLFVTLACGIVFKALAGDVTTYSNLNGEVSSRAGSFEFNNGVPTAVSSASLFEAMDFQRATQVYLWSLPAIGLKGWENANIDAGASSELDGQFVHHADPTYVICLAFSVLVEAVDVSVEDVAR